MSTAGEVQLPVVAVVGRPNVGKSTLVNRIAGRQLAIVEARPGVTRDRLEVECEWNGRSFLVVDTGGVVERGDSLELKVTGQSLRALGSCDLVLFVLDATTGVTGEDEVVAQLVRRNGGQVIVVANKVDSERREAGRLGAGRPRPRRAGDGERPARPGHRGPPRRGGHAAPRPRHDRRRPGPTPPAGSSQRRAEMCAPAAVAIVGRPNVGKSTLFNRLSGEERSVVHDLPGTTRDAIDTLIETDEGTVKLIDTAGMRRRVRSGEGPEFYSLVRALRALDRADVALLVLDATEGVTHQDQRLAERIDASGSPVVILLNKWDLLDTEARLEVAEAVADRLAFLGYAPVLRVSAKSGLGVHRLLPAVHEAMAAYHRRIPTGRLNDALQQRAGGPPRSGGRPYPLRRAGRHRPTHDHAFCHPASPPDLPALHGAVLERALRARPDPDRPACPRPSAAMTASAGRRVDQGLDRGRQVPWCEKCARQVEDDDLVGRPGPASRRRPDCGRHATGARSCGEASSMTPKRLTPRPRGTSKCSSSARSAISATAFIRASAGSSITPEVRGY